MLEQFFPDLYLNCIQEISPELLKSKNISGLILDIDNTLVPYHFEEADENAVKWLEGVTKSGLKACIVSNNSEKRVIKFNEKLKLPAIHRAAKPSKSAYIEAMRLMGTSSSQTAVIGDQIFTDIFGGNRMGLFSILVKPIDKKEQFFIKLKRVLEKIIINSYHKKH